MKHSFRLVRCRSGCAILTGDQTRFFGGFSLCAILIRVAFPDKSSLKAALMLQWCGLGCIYKLWPCAWTYRSRTDISSRVTFDGCTGFRLALPSCGHAVALAGFLFSVSLPTWNSQILTLHHFTSYQSNLSVKKNFKIQYKHFHTLLIKTILRII